MRLSTSENSARWCRWLWLVAFVSFLGLNQAYAQNITLRSPQVQRGSSEVSTFLFRSSDVVTIRWEESLEGLEFKIGTIPGVYGLKSIRLRGSRSSSFTPGVVGLPIGVYYGVISDASADSFTGIQLEASSDPSVKFSREFKFAVESTDAPRAIAPRGTIAERVPTFEWESIPGVVAYALIVSSAPFTVSATGGQITAVEGLNPVWIHLSSDTSALYGERAEANPLIQFAASPLVPGQTYFYTILNAYSKTDPAFLSVVIGPVITFTLQDRGTLDKPVLTFPVAGERIIEQNEVVFDWDDVGGALSYEVSIFERITDDGATSDLQVYSANTPNSSVSVPAFEVFRQGAYRWFVIANDREGAASVSAFASFGYEAEMGDFTFVTRSASDGAELLGVTVSVVSTDGGYSPPNPFVNISSVSFSDSLVVGNYEFTASKDGFADAVVPVQIRNTVRAQVALNLEPLPSRITGQVVDAGGAPVANVDIRLTEIVSGQGFLTSTNQDGIFSRDLRAGTYRLEASKQGFRASQPVVISVGEDQTVTLPDPLVIIDDQVALSGRVINQDGIPIAQVRVRAARQSEEHETITNGDGAWSLDLSEGLWSIAASKEGFLAPVPRVLDLLAGDAFSNINFVLVQQASRIEGQVQGLRVLPDGTQEIFPVEDAEVNAYPLAGAGVSTTTDSQGRFLLDLGTGSYTVFARKAGLGVNGAFELIIRPNQTFRDVRFQLEELSTTIFGTVIDDQGRGIAGADVRSSAGSSVVSGAGGAFVLPVPAEGQEIVARLPGMIPSSALFVAPALHSQIQGVSLTLFSNAATVSGTVRTAAGVLAGLRLSARNGLDVYQTISAPDGSYSFDLPGGNWTIEEHSSRYRLPISQDLAVRAGQHAENVDLWLFEDFILMRGFVGSGSRSLPGLNIEYEDINESTGSPLSLFTKTGEAGSYSLFLGALTRYEMRIEEPSFQSFTHPFTTEVPGGTLDFDADLSPSESLITGAVRDGTGASISDATVSATIGGVPVFSSRTASNGTFSLSLESGSYDVRAQASGYDPVATPISISPGQRIEDVLLTLQSNASTFVISVIDPTNGSRLEGARVTVQGPSNRTGSTNSEGLLGLGGLAPGNYQITVMREGFLSVSRDVVLAASTTSTLTFILVPGPGTISGIVKSASTLAGEGQVTLRLRGTDIDRRAVSDAEGHYRFEDLPDGSYSILAQKAGFALAPAAAASITPATRSVTVPVILLNAATSSIVGTVSEAGAQNLLSGVVVQATSQTGTRSVRSLGDGSFTMEGLEAGTWVLGAHAEGFRHASQSIQVVDGQESSVPIVMTPNQAILTGRIRSVSGEQLPFDVSVEVITSSEQHQQISTAEGRFVFENLPGGEAVILKTRIQREGHVDVGIEYMLPTGAGVLDVGNVPITIQSSAIEGSSGIAEATIRILDAGTNAIVAVSSSGSTGAYEINFLAPGSYIVEPSRLGYRFTPLSRSVTVAHLETGQASFSATSNVGIVELIVTTRTGLAAPGVPIRITSFDRTIDIILTTDENGLILPEGLPLGKRYRAEPIAGEFVFEPPFREIDLVTQTEVSASFTRVEVNSFISGTTRDDQGTDLDQVLITALQSASVEFVGQSVSGQFTLGPLPAGVYSVSGRKSGFNDASLTVTVGENAQVSGVNLVLNRQSVQIRGTVSQGGQPVQGLRVKLSGPASLTTETGPTGVFLFDNVPVETSGQTLAEIAVERPGRPDLVRQVSYTIADVGTIIQIEEIVLSSAMIALELTSGTAPLSAVQIALRGPEGRVIQGVTDINGRFDTQSDLDSGVYILDLIDSDLLSPIESSRTIVLDDARTRVSRELVLPFRHTPPGVVLSDESVSIVIGFEPGSNLSLDSGTLFYRLASTGPFLSVPLSLGAGQFTGAIPPPGEQEFSYRIQITNAGGAAEFESAIITLTPIVAGKLKTIVLSPDPHESTIRVGETYSLFLQIRDGLGQDLSAEVVSSGLVSWTPAGSGLEVQPVVISGQLGALLRADSPGDHAFTVQVQLGNEIHKSTSIFKAVDEPLQTLQITTPEVRLENEGGVLRLNVFGSTANGVQLLLGNSISWSVSPSSAAEIDNTGTVRSRDDRYFGLLTVTAVDRSTGLSEDLSVGVFAKISGERSRFLTDLIGTELFLSAASIPFRAELSLSYPRQPLPRRFDLGSGGIGLTAGSHLIRLSMKSERSLVGDSLGVPAELRLANDPSLRLFEGEFSVGHFNESQLGWQALSSQSTDREVITQNASRLGDYSVVSELTALGIRHLAALPSPFSPDIAALKIGYFLETNSPPATVRIDIVNMRGELIRTILSGDQQWPGRYGSRTGLSQIVWDGLTDDGKKARNGRYIIRIEAKDRSGTVTKILPVVLVK